MTRWWRSHSVRVRLTLSYLGAMVVMLGVYAFAVYGFVSRSASESLDQQLRRDFGWASASVYVGDDGVFTLTEQVDLIRQEDVAWVQVWTADASTLLFRNSEALRRPIPDSQRLAAAAKADAPPIAVPTSTVPIRVLSGRLGIRTMPGASRTPVIIQVARSEDAMRQGLRDLALIFVFGLPLAVGVAGFGGYALARRALAPIERMTERARTITAERLSDRLPVHNPDDEMGRLAAVFNETLARLEQSFEQMRRFTADVSHELRTPLTSIRSVGEVGLRGQRDQAGYRAIVGSMLEEADRLASLVDRLLTLSRAETRQATLSSEPVALGELAEDVAAHLGVLAEEKGQAIAVEGGGVVHALADRLVLRQALIALVDNAIKFTPTGGAIRIRCSASASEAIVDVVDSGPGVASEGRARIFDRFYRAEGTMATGTGLGLSIAKGAVEANGGRLTLETTGPGGSTFRIAMPGAREAEGGIRKLEVGSRK